VVTPSSYKEGKLYSVIPSDGAGDMSVVRATTATRVNSAGLVELVPYNLLQYSEDFTNAAWGKVNATITANATTAPDGTLTADKFESVSSSPESQFFQTINSPSNTISLYAKAGNINTLNIWIGGLVSFNLSTGVVTAGTATMENAGNGWWRCIIPTTYNVFNPFLNTTASGQFVYVWGAQAVEGSTAKDYQKTETRLNIPRLDYSNGSCPSILVEPQRTNILTYSEGNLSTYDVSDNCTNASTSISGFANSIQVPSTGLTYFYKTATTTLSQVYTLSCFIKMDDNSVPVLGANSSLGNLSFVAKGAIAPDNLKVTLVGNNIYRISATTVGNGIPGFFGIVRYSTQTLKSFKTSAIQLELGSYDTSYIPTTSAAVTRNADVISKTGISSLIGQTEGTLFVDFDFDGSGFGLTNDFFLYVGNGTNTDSIYIDYYDNIFRWVVFNGSTIAFYTDLATTNGRHKLALGYKAGQYVAYADGNLILADISNATAPPTCAMVSLAQNVTNFGSMAKEINAAALWKTRLTNDQLELLTGDSFYTYAEMASYYNYTLQ
jgi:hypothetical protein